MSYDKFEELLRKHGKMESKNICIMVDLKGKMEVNFVIVLKLKRLLITVSRKQIHSELE